MRKSLALSIVTLVVIGMAGDTAFADANVGDLMVTEKQPHRVAHFDPNGAYLDRIVEGLEGNAHDVVFTPDGYYMLVATGTLAAPGGVAKYDADDFTFLGYVIPHPDDGVHNLINLAFGHNGELYVTKSATPSHDTSVIEYAFECGETVGDSSEIITGLNAGWYLVVCPNGNLLVAEYFDNRVREYHNNGGAWEQVCEISDDEDIVRPEGLAFGSAGQLYVCTQDEESGVIEYERDPNSGCWLKTRKFLRGSLWEPMGATFGPNGNLFVVSYRNERVVEIDVVNGDPNDPNSQTEFISSNLDYPFDLAFKPIKDCNANGIPDDQDIADCDPNDPDCQDCNENGIPDECDLVCGTETDFNNNGVPDDCECLGDLNGDGEVGLPDLAIILARYGAQCYLRN